LSLKFGAILVLFTVCGYGETAMFHVMASFSTNKIYGPTIVVLVYESRNKITAGS